MTEPTSQTVRWGVRRRLEFIDFRLFWDGHLNRRDLAVTFGISAQQASADIAQYETLAPNNLTYDKVNKTYRRTPLFEPHFITNSSDRFLLQIVAIENGWMRKDETWFETLPPFDVVSLKRRNTRSGILLKILDAIKARSEIEVEYHSLTGSKVGNRRIAPHAMAYCAGRWYVRSWSREHNDFRDYSLNRLLRVDDAFPCSIDPQHDFEWVHTVVLVIAPNPQLPHDKQEAVANEYDMVNGKLSIPTRVSLSFYLMSEHNLDVDPGKLLPEKQQLVLVNKREVEQARALARELSKDALTRNND